MNRDETLFGPLISISEWLALRGGENFLLVDARGGAEAYSSYQKGHLAGAVFVDLEHELSHRSEDAKWGGRHPLPSAEQFCELLSQLGVQATTRVVVYDDKRGANAAARLWWMMRGMGHRRVAVLDGGFQAAVAQGVSVETGTVPRRPTEFKYPVRDWALPVASLAEVRAASDQRQPLIVDVREASRFRGDSEPIDLVAGHIPGAINLPYLENMTDEGFFLSPDQLREKYHKLGLEESSDSPILHCGSGVSACHTLLALDRAGLPIPRLYVGSWSEWSRNGLPIAVGD